MSAAKAMMRREAFGTLVGAGFFACSLAGFAQLSAAASVEYVLTAPATPHVTLDVRPDTQCTAATLPGARCLPVADILGPHGRLPNISGLLWLFGTLGLDGSEHVVVAGRKDRDREFVAGLLHISGQQRVSILDTAIADVLSSGLNSGGIGPAKGHLRGLTRVAVYQAPMRAELVVLRNELVAMIASGSPPLLIDGRGEPEYWGETVRAARGGHLPGAQSSPLEQWRGTPRKPPVHIPGPAPAVVYGHDGYDGIVFLTRVLASGLPAKVLLDGWAAWAADGSLPADSVTYPDLTAARPLPHATTAAATPAPRSMLPILLPAIAFAAIGGFLLGRSRRKGTITT